MRTFTAMYYSDCNECLEKIEPGDTAAYVDDQVVCEDCAEEAS